MTATIAELFLARRPQILLNLEKIHMETILVDSAFRSTMSEEEYDSMHKFNAHEDAGLVEVAKAFYEQEGWYE